MHKTSIGLWVLVQSTVSMIILSIKMKDTFVAHFIVLPPNMDAETKDNFEQTW